MSESEIIQGREMNNQEWIDRWDARAIGFHKEFIHPSLKRNADLMVNGRSSLKIFVPLCGKSWDMKWLADQGHTVIGVEVAQRAIEEFFEEQNIPFTSAPVPAVDGTLFQSEDKKVQIYCCDFFKLSPDVVGHVNGVWDRASLVAINVADRARYAAVIQSLMMPDSRYLLSVLQYDRTKYTGPPHHVGDEDVCNTFESSNTVKEIDSVDALEPSQTERWGIDWLTEKTFLLTPKQ
ncbi:putative thiopurine S-methyltransferase isoform X2 [Babylonia areolata]